MSNIKVLPLKTAGQLVWQTNMTQYLDPHVTHMDKKQPLLTGTMTALM